MSIVKGRIIRIVDNKTVVINLGRELGIDSESVFSILGDAESIIDPATNENLGEIGIVKGKVKAQSVYPKFTIATTEWYYTTVKSDYSIFFPALRDYFGSITESRKHEGQLKVDPQDIKPWRALSETPVKVGDEVIVSLPDKPVAKPETKTIEANSSKRESDDKETKRDDSP